VTHQYLPWPPWAAQQKKSHLCRVAQGGLGKYSSDCHMPLSSKVFLKTSPMYTSLYSQISDLPVKRAKMLYNFSRYPLQKFNMSFSYCSSLSLVYMASGSCNSWQSTHLLLPTSRVLICTLYLPWRLG